MKCRGWSRGRRRGGAGRDHANSLLQLADGRLNPEIASASFKIMRAVPARSYRPAFVLHLQRERRPWGMGSGEGEGTLPWISSPRVKNYRPGVPSGGKKQPHSVYEYRRCALRSVRMRNSIALAAYTRATKNSERSIDRSDERKSDSGGGTAWIPQRRRVSRRSRECRRTALSQIIPE